MVQSSKSPEELHELIEDNALTTPTWIMENEEERKASIMRYIDESQTPTVLDENNPKYFKGTKEHRKMMKRWRKWIKAKRKKYVKYFKEWGPYNTCFLYIPIKMILEDMFEYYKLDDNVFGVPFITDDEGQIVRQDTRKETLAQALALLEIAEYEEDFGDYELSQQQFRIAFNYIAEHMNEWWD